MPPYVICAGTDVTMSPLYLIDFEVGRSFRDLQSEVCYFRLLDFGRRFRRMVRSTSARSTNPSYLCFLTVAK